MATAPKTVPANEKPTLAIVKSEAENIAKITTRTLGNPQKIIAALPETETRFVMGNIYGEAVGISRRTSADGESVQEGLKGSFEAVSSDTAESVKRSAVLYAPSNLLENLLKFFRGDNPIKSMIIGFEVSVLRAKDLPEGYRWEILPLVADRAAIDPLAVARTKMTEALAERDKSAKTAKK